MKSTPWRIWALLGLAIVFAMLTVQQLRGISYQEAANNVIDGSFAEVNVTDHSRLSALDKEDQLGVVSKVSNESKQSDDRTTMTSTLRYGYADSVLNLPSFST